MVSTWIKYLTELKSEEPIVVVGSPGLRSVGELVVDQLIHDLKAHLIAELYSTHFPTFYQSSPSYAPSPDLPGEAGVRVICQNPELPKIEFHYSSFPELLFVKGLHANFYGQYEVAEIVLDFIEKSRSKMMVAVAGFAHGETEVCCAATNSRLIEEMNKYEIRTEYTGPFYGFTGLVFGLATLRDLNGVCLFGRTKPNPEYPEEPDPEAAKMVLEKFFQILEIKPESPASETK